MADLQKLYCYCCGEQYKRGHFRCCAAPSGMAKHQWLEKFCHVCGTQQRGKCPSHCTCPKQERSPVVLDTWQNTAAIAKTIRREWLPYREPGEEG